VVLAETVSTQFGPPFKAALRVWLAFAIVGPAPSNWFPVESLASPNRLGAWTPAALLALGLATPLVSSALALICARAAMSVGASLYYASLLFLLLAFSGAGRWSLDAWWQGLLERRPTLPGKRPRVVIVGAGFGGLKCASRLKDEAVDVTLIDRNNYHLFQPLLYQVATAGLSPADIAFPIRALFRDNRAIRVLRGTVTGVDAARRAVMVDGREIGYDYLVLATGATHGYFGHEEWSANALGLKRVEDAIGIRARVLSAFERAEVATDRTERARLLTFVICGAGPTGVELAGAIADLAHFGLSDEFRSIDPTSARIVLVQAGPRVLPTFPEGLSLAAQTSLEKMGVEVRLNGRVEKVEVGCAIVNGEAMPAGTVLWAAGVVASPAARWLGHEPDSAGRLTVGPDLSVPGHPEIFGIGDTVSVAAWNGRPAPGLAPAAKQGGAYVAEALCARIYGDPPPPLFRYRHWGSLATLGRKSAVVDLGRITLSGVVAWWFWGTVHLLLVVGLRNRASVLLGWFWSYATYQVGVQLVTGLTVAEAAAGPSAKSPPTDT
jgi:NADH dehydrogenase FAD-containing subunit